MSLTKYQKGRIAHMVRVGHMSYCKIAKELGVPESEVAKIGRPINAERRKVRDGYKELDNLVSHATYDYKPYQDQTVAARDSETGFAKIVAYVCLTCILILSIAGTIALIKSMFGA